MCVVIAHKVMALSTALSKQRVGMFTRMSGRMPMCAPIHLSVPMSAPMLPRLSVHMSTHMSMHMSTYICPCTRRYEGVNITVLGDYDCALRRLGWQTGEGPACKGAYRHVYRHGCRRAWSTKLAGKAASGRIAGVRRGNDCTHVCTHA